MSSYPSGRTRAVRARSLLLPLTLAGVALGAAPVAAAPPEGRVYEQVSPRDKQAGNPIINGYELFGPYGWSAPDGNRMSWLAYGGASTPDAARGFNSPVIAERTATGWTARTAVQGPTPDSPYAQVDNDLVQVLPNSDRSAFAFISNFRMSEEMPPASSSRETGGVFKTDATGRPEWVSRPTWPGTTQHPPAAANIYFEILGGSPDLATVYFTSRTLMDPADAAAGRSTDRSWALYRNSGGAVSSASLLPDGTVDPGGAVAAGMRAYDGNAQEGASSAWTHSISQDGRSALFVSPDPASTEGSGRPPQLLPQRRRQTVDAAVGDARRRRERDRRPADRPQLRRRDARPSLRLLRLRRRADRRRAAGRRRPAQGLPLRQQRRVARLSAGGLVPGAGPGADRGGQRRRARARVHQPRLHAADLA